jgi:sec-independent protein translocase protein TatA
MGSIGAPELLLIFLAVLLLFGAKRIPEIARGLGKGIREFKDATRDIKREIEYSADDRPRVQSPQYGTSAPRTDTYAAPQPQEPPRAEGENAPQTEPRS